MVEESKMVGVGGSRRVRRFGRQQNTSVLPISTYRTSHHQHHNTLSFWFCDFKIFSLNPFLFSFGRKHASFLRMWFSIGTGFGLTTLVGVTLILLGELGAALHLYSYNAWLHDVSSRFMFGFSPLPKVAGFGMSVMDAGYIVVSTLLSVVFHEFGHAIAAARQASRMKVNFAKSVVYDVGVDARVEEAATILGCGQGSFRPGTTSTENSEGIQIEYISVFLAVLFPGALVAFSYDLVQCLPHYSALRIYCAGIWHNAVCCLACALTLLLLPVILSPFYIHGQNPLVLDVASVSPLSDSLSRGDIIVSLDGLQIRDPQEWVEKLTDINTHALQVSHHSQDPNNVNAAMEKKGYCIPSSSLNDQQKIKLEDDQSSCSNGLTAFSNLPCFGLDVLNKGNLEDEHWNRSGYCLRADDVIQLKKCGNGWLSGTMETSCLCAEDETCLTPVLAPNLIWVEIVYRRPYSSECLWPGRNSSLDFAGPDSRATTCGGTFVFVGPMLSIEHSVRLTAYRSRWGFAFGVNIPNILEKFCICTFHVSLTLALLNSLPVFLLDGESIVEVIINFIPLFRPRNRAKVLRVCLFSGTLLTILAFSRAIINFL